MSGLQPCLFLWTSFVCATGQADHDRAARVLEGLRYGVYGGERQGRGRCGEMCAVSYKLTSDPLGTWCGHEQRNARVASVLT